MEKIEHLSRRGFLRGMVAGTASLAASVSAIEKTVAESFAGLRALTPPEKDSWLFDGGYWAKIRRQFMLEEGLAYMNNGTLGPTPAPVYEAMVRYWRLMAENPHENSLVLQRRKDEELRHKVARFLDASPDEIAITRNTTEGNTILCQGIDDLRQGDEIVISAFEHNSCKQTWLREAKRRGYVVTEVKYPNPPSGPDEILTAFEAAITPRTRVIHMATPTPSYGCLQPVKKLAALARSKGVLFFVDGAHSPGMVRFSLREWGVDGFASNSHKWLCGPAGAGILYVRREVQDRIWPNIAIHSGSPRGARKYAQSVGRRPWPAVAALEHTLDFHLAVGRDRIERRLRALGSFLREGVGQIPGAELYTSNDPRLAAGITRVGVKGVSGRRLAEYLRQRYDVYVPAGREGVRVSTHFYNTFEQVDRVLEGLATAARGGI